MDWWRTDPERMTAFFALSKVSGTLLARIWGVVVGLYFWTAIGWLIAIVRAGAGPVGGLGLLVQAL